MASGARIAVPWLQRWRWIRFQLLPVGFFGLAVVGTGLLWSRQVGSTTTVGEVFATRMDLASQVSGLLVSISPDDPASDLRLFQKVAANQVVARLDDEPSKLALETMRVEVKRLQQEINKVNEDLRLTQADREQRRNSSVRQLAALVEQRRITALKLQTELEADKILLQQNVEQYEINKDAFERNTVSKLQLIAAKYQRDIVQKRIEENKKAVEEAKRQITASRERQRTLAPTVLTEFEPLLAPVRTAIDTQEAKIREIELTIDQLQIRSPINGVVAAVLKRPGQTVAAGEPILTVAAEQGEYIVSYFRQGRNLQPAPRMAVNIRRRNLPIETLTSRIEQIGPRYELIPPHQTPDPKVPLWGRPARIFIPAGVKLTPGELVDIRLLPHAADEPPKSGPVPTQTADHPGS